MNVHLSGLPASGTRKRCSGMRGSGESPTPERRWVGEAAPRERKGGGGGAEPAPRSTAGGGDPPRCSPMGAVALPFLPLPFSTPSPGPGRREAAALQPGQRRGAGPGAAPHGLSPPLSASAETPAWGKDVGERPPPSAAARAGSGAAPARRSRRRKKKRRGRERSRREVGKLSLARPVRSRSHGPRRGCSGRPLAAALAAARGLGPALAAGGEAG